MEILKNTFIKYIDLMLFENWNVLGLPLPTLLSLKTL